MSKELDDLMKERLKNLSWVTNRRMEQLVFLFELCDNNFDKLLALEAKLKQSFVYVCPATKEQLEYVMGVSEGSYDASRMRILGMFGYATNMVGLEEKVEVP